jgi:ribonuclease-3
VKRRINQLISLFKKTGFKADLKHLIGYNTGNILLFQTALNHRSVKDNPTENNERLEF